MSEETVAERYARAIFELGLESKSVDSLLEDMRKLADAYRESPDMQRAVNSPLIPEEGRVAAVREIAQRLGLSHTATNAAGLLTKRRRMDAIAEIVRELAAMSDEEAGLARATVISAEPLSDAYAERLAEELSAMTGKKIVLERRQDPDLLAGLVVRIGDEVIDGSARARLSALRAQLLSL